MFGGIEAGGTKFVLAVSDDDLTIVKQVSIDTRSPEETLTDVIDFFKPYSIKALGIGSFGPVDVSPSSASYGTILKTPKPGWQDFPFLDALKAAFSIPMFLQTDVNVAAYGEAHLGIAKEHGSSIYLTVGTGVGGGYVVEHQFVHTKNQQEMGHILLQMIPNGILKSHCPFHHGCLEGLVAGPAIEKSVGMKASLIKEDHPVWNEVAFYLAQAAMNYTLICSPDSIVFGGGVMHQTQIMPMIKKHYTELMNGYVEVGNLDNYLLTPGLGDNAGIMGALLLARELI